MKTILFLFFMIPLETIQAQKHEFGLHLTAINSINRPTVSSDKTEFFKTFYAIAANYGFEYFYRLNTSKNRFYISVTNSSIKTRVKHNAFPRPDRPNPTASSGSSARENFWGLKYGINKQGFLFNNMDLTMGLFTKFQHQTFTGLGRTSCTQYKCLGMFIAEDNYAKENIDFHTSLFLKIDFVLFKSKKSRHFICTHLIFNYGLQKINKTYHYLKNVLTDEEFNFQLVNRGSYFGLGLSYQLGSTNDKFKSIFKFRE